MDEYVGDIRQRVLERMDLSREMSDEEIEKSDWGKRHPG